MKMSQSHLIHKVNDKDNTSRNRDTSNINKMIDSDKKKNLLNESLNLNIIHPKENRITHIKQYYFKR